MGTSVIGLGLSMARTATDPREQRGSLLAGGGALMLACGIQTALVWLGLTGDAADRFVGTALACAIGVFMVFGIGKFARELWRALHGAVPLKPGDALMHTMMAGMLTGIATGTVVGAALWLLRVPEYETVGLVVFLGGCGVGGVLAHRRLARIAAAQE